MIYLFARSRKNNIAVWSEVELAYTMTPCPVIAITGTNGKTTTTNISRRNIKIRISKIQ